MYTVQREAARSSHMNHPASSVRKYTPARAAVPGYCQEPSESDHSQSLGYTMASAGALAHMPIQREPDDKSNFFDGLTEIIQRHINAAAPNPQIAPLNKDTLWGNIKTDFSTDRNIEILISKILSINTPGVENQTSQSSVYYEDFYKNYTKEENKGETITDTVNTAFNGLGQPISETLNDIFYWTALDNANTVSAIQLTDSDLHYRGVGVCIVDYQNNSGQKKIVVKPEDKTFDKTIYGKKDANAADGFQSLADDFNDSLCKGSLGKRFKKSRIGTLGIQTSNNNEFGSAMEFFEHKRFDRNDRTMLDNIDLHSVESLIAFSSLLGLADLHVENAVYSQAPKHAMQLIDAEIGMKYILDFADNLPLLMTAMHKGEMLYPAPSIDRTSITSEDFENYNPDILSDFLNTARQKLEGKKSRIVLLATPRLFIYRSQYLAGFNDWYVSDGHTYNLELSGAVEQYYNGILVPILMQKSDICLRYAEKDFAAGRIPFFELHYSTGKIWQVLPGEEIPIATYVRPDGVPFLNFMIQSRTDALAQEFLKIQERRKEQRNKKIMAGIGMTAIAAIAGGAGLGLYYRFHKN